MFPVRELPDPSHAATRSHGDGICRASGPMFQEWPEMPTTPPSRRSLFRLRPPRMWLCSCAGLALLTLSSGATPPAQNAPPPPPAAPQLVAAAPASAPAAPQASPMDEAIRILTEARKVYATVQDYTCVMIKKEKMGDQPPVENVMAMKVR